MKGYMKLPSIVKGRVAYAVLGLAAAAFTVKVYACSIQECESACETCINNARSVYYSDMAACLWYPEGPARQGCEDSADDKKNRAETQCDFDEFMCEANCPYQ